MKKLLVLSICLLSLNLIACADDKPIPITEIPANAQKFIKQHFTSVKVAYATTERYWFDETYEVTFTNGDNIEFDKTGEWTDVDCTKSSVPATIIPKEIADYVTKNYKDVHILEISRDKKDYEVELSNRLELKFDLKFNLIAIDN